MRSQNAGPSPGVGPSGIPMPNSDLTGWDLIFSDDFLIPVAEGTWTGCVAGEDPIDNACSGLPTGVMEKWFSFSDGWVDSQGGGIFRPSEVNSIHDHMLHARLHNSGGEDKVTAFEPRITGYGQIYGRYAVCWKSDATPGSKVAWQLWPDSEIWPRDGEIDFPEASLNGTTEGFVHKQDATSGDDADVYSTGIPFGDNLWHTAVIEWGPTSLKLFLDDALIGNTTSRIPNTSMHYIMQCVNNLAEDGLPAPNSVANIYIDWVAIWSYVP